MPWTSCWGTRRATCRAWWNWPWIPSIGPSRPILPRWRNRNWNGCGRSAMACPGLPTRLHGSTYGRFLDLRSPALHPGGFPGNGGLTLGAFQAAKGLRWPIVFILDAE